MPTGKAIPVVAEPLDDDDNDTIVGNDDDATSSPAAPSAVSPKSNGNGNDGPPTDRYKVKLSHPLSHAKTVFNSVSERRARAFIQNRFPRGEEAYLAMPDGSFESYQAERAGPYGEDMDQWQPFDPEAYKPPEEQDPPGQSQWADVEG